jgi:ELWxxDGT repeat protein
MSSLRRISCRLLVAGVLFAPAVSPAQPFLVENINQDQGPGLDSSPRGFTALPQAAVFFADDGVHGDEPWVTDGQTGGTALLADLVPGAGGSAGRPLAVIGDLLYFAATTDRDSAPSLWRTDGTAAGTVRLSYGEELQGLGAVGVVEDRGLFFFNGGGEEWGEGLWVSDGTPAGTGQLAQVVPGRGPGEPLVGLAWDGRLYFAGLDEAGLTGLTPWVSDGTVDGTYRIGALRLVPGDAWPPSSGVLGALPEGVLIRAEDDEGRGLWITDGTTAGTRPLLRLDEGERLLGVTTVGHAVLGMTQNVGGGTVLWRADVLSADILLLASFPASGYGGGQMITVGARVLFTADDGIHGLEPWVTDGTAAGTSLLGDFCPGPETSFPNLRGTTRSFGGHFSVEEDASDSPSYWLTDGTLEGSRRLFEVGKYGSMGIMGEVGGRLVAGFCGGSVPTCGLFSLETPFGDIDYFGYGVLIPGLGEAVVGDWMILAGTDPEHGEEPWVTDGTADGTSLLIDIAAEGDGDALPAELTPFGGGILFTASDGSRQGLWAADRSGAQRVADVAAPESLDRVTNLTRAGGRAFFLVRHWESSEQHGIDLWTTRGTPRSTRRIGRVGDISTSLRALGELVIGFGSEVWRSDGTPQGTERLAQLSSPSFQGVATAVLRGEVFFTARIEQEEGEAFELWKTDGTREGTVRVAAPGWRWPGPWRFLTGAGRVYFSAEDDALGSELWVTDGTAAGTVPFADLRPGPEGSRPVALAVFGPRVLVSRLDSPGALTLWATDGTLWGTERLAPISQRNDLPVGAALGGRFYFAGPGGEGCEILVTDGTAAGTAVTGLLPDHRFAEGFWTWGDKQLILASEPPILGDLELWVSDATRPGTRRLAAVGPRDLFTSFEPFELAVAGGAVYFTAWTRETGRELWAVDLLALPAPPPRPPASPADLAVAAIGPERIELTWRDRSADETSFLLERRSPACGGACAALRLPAETTRVALSLPPGVPYAFRVRAEGDGGLSEPSNEVSATAVGETTPAGCVPSAEVACLHGDRFAVRVFWLRGGLSGSGRQRPFPGTDRAVLFRFFHPEAGDLALKVLDGGAVNSRFWIFAAPLTDAEIWASVIDAREGRSWTFHKPPAGRCGTADPGAFPSAATTSDDRTRASDAAAAVAGGAAVAGDFAPAAPPLYLLGGRIRAEVVWTDPATGNEGAGRALPVTDRIGAFWFFHPANPELVVKLVDGGMYDGRLWVFAAPLTGVGYRLTLTDTVTGAIWSADHPAGDLCAKWDLAAF